jgi:hypothetical protein
MTVSMYQISVPVCIRALTNLDNILRKGQAYALEENVDETVILNSRLALDMFPLLRQVQITSDLSKGVGARLAGIENPSFEDKEKSFAELYDRLRKTVEFLSGISAEQMDRSDEKIVEVKLPGHLLKFRGIDYLIGFALPNVSFHITTAYNILRHNGVDLGKPDYLGDLPTV